MGEIKVGFAMCGSFCTFQKALTALEGLAGEGYDITPIMSGNAATTDTRFGRAEDIKKKMETISGKTVIDSIKEAEPIGPRALIDILVIAPCTGNTLAKLASGITDTSVTMAAKAHLRNDRPILIAVSTNDALGASARSIGMLINRKNIFFVPMRQDDPVGKPCSMVADFGLLPSALSRALEGKQISPVYL